MILSLNDYPSGNHSIEVFFEGARHWRAFFYVFNSSDTPYKEILHQANE